MGMKTPMFEREIRALAETLSPDMLHEVMRAMIDRRLETRKPYTVEEITQQRALVDACAAYEAVVDPLPS